MDLLAWAIFVILNAGLGLFVHHKYPVRKHMARIDSSIKDIKKLQ